MVDNLVFLGSYKDKLKGNTYEEKLDRLFGYINGIFNLGWNILDEEKEEGKVVLIAAGTIVKEGSLLFNRLKESEKQFDRISERNGTRIESLFP